MTEKKMTVNTYEIQRDCFLGKKGQQIELNARQAANPMAGGYVALVKVGTPAKAKGAK